ncbi:MAG TPA: class I tRNA ligase family protein, partial [Syntrophales bacterium]|nr:class I tRNA ligase family protein [Syntrophales bacterium]
NTGRYILGNLYDFDCRHDKVPYGEMEEMDRWILHRLQEIVQRVRKAYDEYQFHVVYYTIYNFCTVDLSSLYLDVSKDRMYTAKAKSKARRSAQSAMYIILDTLVRLLAPILTFTADEIWNAMPEYEDKAVSVHLTQFPDVNPEFLNEKIKEAWKTLIAVRGEVSKAIEKARKNKVIGHSLDARVDLYAPEKLRRFLADRREDLKVLNIVSQVNILDRDDLEEPYVSSEIEGLKVGVSKASGAKCQRCWMYSETVGKDAVHTTICDRCLANLSAEAPL